MYKEDAINQLRRYYLSIGFKTSEIDKIIKKSEIRSIELVKIRIEDYQELLNVSLDKLVKMINQYPLLICLETVGKKSTSVESKIKNYQEILHVDKDTVVKMITQFPVMLGYDCSENEKNNVRSKIKDYQNFLQIDEESVVKMICKNPSLLGFDVNKHITEIFSYYQNALHIDRQALVQTVMSEPEMFNYRIDDSTSSVKTKIKKMLEMIPIEKLKKIVVSHPKILSVPAQKFKIRYMLAEDIGVMSRFLTNGFIADQNKVWARFCHITSKHPTAISRNNVYVDEARFNFYCGAKTCDLLEKYPLNLDAVHKIKNIYQNKTGVQIKLDELELQALGLCEFEKEL